MTNQTDNLSWEQLSYSQKADRVLGNVNLTSEQRGNAMKEWVSRAYENTVEGRTRALTELQTIAVDQVTSDEDKDAIRQQRERHKKEILGV